MKFKRGLPTLAGFGCVLLLLLSVASAQSGVVASIADGGYDLSWWTVDGGGGTRVPLHGLGIDVEEGTVVGQGAAEAVEQGTQVAAGLGVGRVGPELEGEVGAGLGGITVEEEFGSAHCEEILGSRLDQPGGCERYQKERRIDLCRRIAGVAVETVKARL